MIRRLGLFWRRSSNERQAAMWVERMLDDPARHEAGLRRWVGGDQYRADLYNAARRAVLESEAPAAMLFGDAEERARWVPLPSRWSGRHLSIGIGFAMLLGGAGLGFGLGVLNGSLRLPGAPISSATPTIIATRVGEIRRVDLSDGTHVTLDTDSLLHVDFSKAVRSVRLDRGRARFEVAHNPDWPFVVAAGGGTITARGTVFDVAVYRLVKVQLLSGAIEVRYPRGTGSAAPGLLRLTAGEQVRYDPSMSDEPPAPSQARASDAQWVSGMRTFDDVPVSDIIEEANRYSDTKIELADPALGNREVFLDLDLRNTREVARNLAILLGLATDETRPGLIILIPTGEK